MYTVKNIFAVFAIALVMQVMKTANAMDDQAAIRRKMSALHECYYLGEKQRGNGEIAACFFKTQPKGSQGFFDVTRTTQDPKTGVTKQTHDGKFDQDANYATFMDLKNQYAQQQEKLNK
ncbi:MAG: hypothetical protein AB7F19_05265 [Candidatus Babeliales bacterium]